MSAENAVDYLDEDVVTVPGQNFALLSFVGPNQRQKNERMGMKIRGVFNTREDADAHVKKLRKFDTQLDVFLVDMYRWVLIPPPTNPLELEHADVEYDQKFLNDLMKGYRESQQLARAHFEERKRAVLEEGLDKHLDESEKLPPPPEEVLQNPQTIFEVEDPALTRKKQKEQTKQDEQRDEPGPSSA